MIEDAGVSTRATCTNPPHLEPTQLSIPSWILLGIRLPVRLLRRLGINYLTGLCCWMLVSCAPLHHPERTLQTSTLSTPNQPSELHWSGRMQIDVKGVRTLHITNDFELDVSDQEGELRILGPLGSTLAVITWGTPEMPATLESPQMSPRVQSFDNLDSLMSHWLGTPIPSRTLLGWLQGQAVSEPGWEFSHTSNAVFVAHRFEPEPAVDFKIIRSSD